MHFGLFFAVQPPRTGAEKVEQKRAGETGRDVTDAGLKIPCRPALMLNIGLTEPTFNIKRGAP